MISQVKKNIDSVVFMATSMSINLENIFSSSSR